MNLWRFIISSFVLFSISGPDMAVRSALDQSEIYTDGLRMVVVDFEHIDSKSQPLCFVYANSSLSDVVTSKPTYVSAESMDDMIEECHRIHSDLPPAEDDAEHIRQKRGAIPMYPGTKWCGDGNTSKDYDDLGENRETDICCREHDHCQEYILPFKRRYGLFNWSSFTSCSCDCDYALYDCLKNSTDAAADRIGYIFFNVLGKKCFKYEYTGMCLKRILFVCVKRGLNTAEPKVMRFSKVPKY